MRYCILVSVKHLELCYGLNAYTCGKRGLSLCITPLCNVLLYCSPSRGRSGMRSGWGGEIGGTGVDHYGNPGTAFDSSLVPLSRSMSSLNDEKKEAPIDTVKWVLTCVSYYPWTLWYNVQFSYPHFVFWSSVPFLTEYMYLFTYQLTLKHVPLNFYSMCIQICHLSFFCSWPHSLLCNILFLSQNHILLISL